MKDEEKDCFEINHVHGNDIAKPENAKFAEFFEATFKGKIEMENSCVFASNHEGNPIGFIEHRARSGKDEEFNQRPIALNKEIFFNYGYIVPEYRGRGIHDKMFEYLEAHGKGFDTISTFATSGSGLRAAEKLGFKDGDESSDGLRRFFIDPEKATKTFIEAQPQRIVCPPKIEEQNKEEAPKTSVGINYFGESLRDDENQL
jgi:GNAT superfamily N-acetyltransferase